MPTPHPYRLPAAIGAAATAYTAITGHLDLTSYVLGAGVCAIGLCWFAARRETRWQHVIIGRTHESCERVAEHHGVPAGDATIFVATDLPAAPVALVGSVRIIYAGDWRDGTYWAAHADQLTAQVGGFLTEGATHGAAC